MEPNVRCVQILTSSHIPSYISASSSAPLYLVSSSLISFSHHSSYTFLIYKSVSTEIVVFCSFTNNSSNPHFSASSSPNPMESHALVSSHAFHRSTKCFHINDAMHRCSSSGVSFVESFSCFRISIEWGFHTYTIGKRNNPVWSKVISGKSFSNLLTVSYDGAIFLTCIPSATFSVFMHLH